MKRLHLKIHPRFSIWLLLLGILVGLFLTAQWRARPTRVVNPLLPYTSLRETWEILQKENEDLKKQIGQLQEKITASSNLLKEGKIVSSSSLEELKNLKEKVGLTPKEGEGILITLADSEGKFASSETIVHASDLRDLINLLWESGAEAISINEERVSANTSIDCIVNTILINNRRFTSPFLIVALGDSFKLKKALEDEDKLPDLYRRKKLGLNFSISPLKELKLPSYNGSYAIEFAKIAKE